MTKQANLPKAVRQRFNLANRRRKAWKERPDHMESIRQRATKAAKAVREGKHQLLVHRLSLLPAEIPADDLKALVQGIYPARFSHKSFLNRIRRHNLLAYDPFLHLWVNRCRKDGGLTRGSPALGFGADPESRA